MGTCLHQTLVVGHQNRAGVDLQSREVACQSLVEGREGTLQNLLQTLQVVVPLQTRTLT